MNSPVQQIKERLPIEEVVSSYIKLEKAGANLKAKCPFHNEKTPSFFVSPTRNNYYCFGCGASGDIFTFVEEFEGLDFKGALKMLADRAGVELPRFNPKEESEREKLYRIMEAATLYFENNLGTNEKALEYLKSRGLLEKTIQDFRIGFAKDEWRGLYDNLRQKFTDADLERAGLIKKTEGKLYDRFRGRIMFPLCDSSGRVIAFSGRIFGEGEPKYLNSPETPIFSKNAVLYGINKAKDSIRKNNFSILVEGQLDLILSHQAGYKNTVAASGTALSDSTVSKENIVSNLGLVRRLSGNIVLAYDADRAGAVATVRAGRIALSLGMDVKVADLPEGADPADCVSKFGPEAWKEAIKNSKHLIEFLLGKVLKNFPDARRAGREIKEKVLPFVSALESSIEQAHFLKTISDLSGIPLSALRDDLGKIGREQKSEKEELEEAKENLSAARRRDYIQRKLLGVVFWQKVLEEKSIDVDDVSKKMAEILKISPLELLEEAKDSRDDLIFEAEVFYGGDADLEKDVREMIGNLEEECLKEELERKMRELREAEEKKDSQKSAEILQECQVLNNKIQDIKNGRLKNK